MAGFANFRARVDAEMNGAVGVWSFRKTINSSFGSGRWVDFSMFQGSPPPNYYASNPLVGNPLKFSEDGGIRHAGTVSPAQQFLSRLLLLRTGTAGGYQAGWLLDYLMFYPFVDMADTSTQVLSTPLPLPRYADGEGVRIMPVIVAQQSGGGTLQCGYTNSQGVAGRLTTPVVVTTASAVGVLATALASGNGAMFLPLQAGDTGVRTIDSVVMTPADVGLVTLLLVKPLCSWQLIDDAPVEIAFLHDRPLAPRIQDDAFLGLVACISGTLESRAVMGLIETVWH